MGSKIHLEQVHLLEMPRPKKGRKIFASERKFSVISYQRRSNPTVPPPVFPEWPAGEEKNMCN